ncbi:MAG: endonuclease MutS2 [Clostridia bacterium]|nr:endonuclease MutS2 [Clostridia bacterium]
MENTKFESAVRALEFDKIRERLAHFAPTYGAKARARELMPTSSAVMVKKMLAETDAAYSAIAAKGMPPFGGVTDILDALDRADRGASLQLCELLDVARVLAATRALKEYNSFAHGEEPTALDDYFHRLVPQKHLEDEINSAVIGPETLADTASDELYNIRRKMRAAENRVRENLQKFVTGGTYSKYLQENIITMRDGRYVIPVKLEYKNEIKGLVHDTSASGSTLFIEPLSVVEANNELRMLEGKEKDEIERIIALLSAEVAAVAGGIATDYEIITDLAFIFAKGQLSFSYNGMCPKITEGREINLISARHPLLAKETVVPVTVSLGKDFDTLIITGPNTGGKTVTLKTLGLFALMTQAGLHIPAADGSVMCIFDEILPDIGDEQSIEQSLSTFSSHMVKIVDIIGRVTERSLVLFDELGAGTDPIEGAALAMAIIEAMREKHALVAATTHYVELKSFAMDTEGVCNASCEFDVETLRPTYKLIIGTPGKSNAFAISGKLGLPEAILARAERFVSGEDKRFERVIDKLESERMKMEKSRAEADMLLTQMTAKKSESDTEAERKLAEAQKELEKAREQARRMVEAAKASSEFIFAELEKAKKQKDKENLAQTLEETRKAIRAHLKDNTDEIDPVFKTEMGDYKLPRELRAGDGVIVVDLNKKGEVTSAPDNKGNVMVKVGNATMKINSSRLMLIDGKTVICKEKEKRQTVSLYRERAVTSFAPQLDLRGKYGDEACEMVDKYIDDALRVGVKTIRIVHGKGTGVLRRRVTEYLKNDTRVLSVRIGEWGEGDTGVSIAELR